MTSEEAKTTLISRVEEEARHEMAMKLSEIESEYKETAEEKARDIITTAIFISLFFSLVHWNVKFM